MEKNMKVQTDCSSEDIEIGSTPKPYSSPLATSSRLKGILLSVETQGIE